MKTTGQEKTHNLPWELQKINGGIRFIRANKKKKKKLYWEIQMRGNGNCGGQWSPTSYKRHTDKLNKKYLKLNRKKLIIHLLKSR